MKAKFTIERLKSRNCATCTVGTDKSKLVSRTQEGHFSSLFINELRQLSSSRATSVRARKKGDSPLLENGGSQQQAGGGSTGVAC